MSGDCWPFIWSFNLTAAESHGFLKSLYSSVRRAGDMWVTNKPAWQHDPDSVSSMIKS